jgi:hypothetical protein
MAKQTTPAVYVDAQGQTVPAQYVKPYDKARDKVARRILARFQKGNAYLARLKADTLADIDALRSFDGAGLGGAKGNIQFSSFDGLVRVRVDARTLVDFDDRFRQAQALIFAYVDELTGATGQGDVAEIIRAAFRPNGSGMLSRARVMGLLRLNIKHPQWVSAMELLRECQFVKSGRSYLYCETKAGRDAEFEAIPLDLAAIDPAVDEPKEGGAE